MEIECDFEVASWVAAGSLYTCTVKSSSITKRGIKVTSCKGVHEEGNSNADVEAIRFAHTVVEYFPIGLDKIFPNLKNLHVSGCGLKEISRWDLIGLENLHGLWLSFNPLQSLPDNLLKGMKKLTEVSFLANNLEIVSSNLLQPIMNNKLTLVDFGNNPTNIGYFLPGVPGSVGSLKELCDNIDAKCKKPMDPVDDEFSKRSVRGFKELWISGRLSDFKIVCGSKAFKVHKNVLAIQSSVLAAAVESDMQEIKTGQMEIEDFSKEAVEDFLKYLYTGEAPEETNAMDILALASKYNVPALQFLMEEIILRNIDETNVIEILTMSKQHNCEMLAQAAFNKIQDIISENLQRSKLDSSMIDKPERLQQLIEMKCDYEKLLKSCSKIEE